jgi:mannitol/fructose-specific phosphotransferase system IIA component (Ntr-type)
MEWAGRTRWTLTVANPLGWLREHLQANLATFHDAGVRYLQKILVFVEPGPHDALVIHTADRLAQREGAELTFIRFVGNDAPLTQDQAEADYLDQVRNMCRVPAKTLIVRGRNEAEAIGEQTAGFDLLIMGGTVKRSRMRYMLGTMRDKLTAQAACSVLRLRTPRVQTHEAYRGDREGTKDEGFNLLSYVEDGCVGARLDVRNKDGAFQKIADAFAGVMPDFSAEQIRDALRERERAQNTSIGQGIALPHATLPGVERTYVGIFTSKSPVDYGAPDGQGADVFFATLGGPGDRSRHLLVLSTVARLVKMTSMVERLRDAGDPEKILGIVKDCSSRISD